MKTYIGVDLGGTNVRVAKVDESGNVLQVLKEETEAKQGPEHILSKIERMIASLDDYESCEGIGLGIPGPIDTQAGKIIVSNNLPDLIGYPIADRFKKHFNKPVFMDNDVNVAGLGEALQGAGKDNRIVYYLTVSTGVGGALVVEEKLIAGANGHAGEVGNMILDPHRPARAGLNTGATESEMSGPALTRKASEALQRPIAHAGELFELTAQGDEKAKELVENFKDDFARLLSGIAFVVDPDIFVIGGGVMKSSEHFFEDVVERYRSLVFPGMRNVKFAKAQLDEPGLIGAAMLPMAYIK